MLNLFFLRKDAPEVQKYIFILFLAGSRLYGFAFEEANSKNRSALYQEPVDPFLKNASEKINKIIGNCEKDLDENAYLKKTVLVLNSFYTTETGAIKENFFKEIKNLLKKVDLENLGYLNFYEVVLNNFDQEKHYTFLEESLYDYCLYEIRDQAVKKVRKIAKAQDSQDSLKEVKKHLELKQAVVAWLSKDWPKPDFEIKHYLTETHLIDLLLNVYFKDKKAPPEKIASEILPMAPGFSSSASGQTSKVSMAVQKPKFSLPKLNWNLKIPSFSSKTTFYLIAAGFLFLIFIYLFFLHKATIILQTKKENFSSDINFTVSNNTDFIKTYVTEVDFTVSELTTGEKVTGEKARGEITIYNGLFENKELSKGFVFQSANGVVFLLDEDILVPSATTSADLNEGLRTTAFGKKNAAVTAAEIGAEGNLDNGIKLITEEYSNDEFYALTNGEFSGGVKKTVAVFTDKDAAILNKKALTMSKNKLLDEFKKTNSDSGILFSETVSAAGVKKSYSAEINDEVNRVSLSYRGQVKAFYAPYNSLVKMVQRQKLKDKEFVEDTFALTKIKLVDQNNNRFTYAAIVKGQVQNFLDKEALLEDLKGKLKTSAQKVLESQRYITDFEINTGPLPIPLLPFQESAIKFEFNQ